MIVNNQKYACNSCIKGHRVSACNHIQREVFPIAKKGRPVKQCEHCRSARKDKSHHAKCDCGSKKHKDATSIKTEQNNENTGCCCRNGTKCVCSSKTEDIRLRVEAISNRPKPTLTTSTSEPKLAHGLPSQFHGRPSHHNYKNDAHNRLGLPYKIARPHTVHNPSYARELENSSMSRSIDDLQASGDAYGVYGMGMGFGAQSEDNLLTSPFDSTFDPGLFSSYSPALAGSVDGNGLTRTTSADALSASMTWYETNLPTVSESLGDYSTSPIGMFDFTGQDFTIPSATSVDFFSPSDLPLVTSNPADFSQPISNSGESNYQSAPALTASSGARSELGEPAFPIDGESSGPANITSQWSGTIQLRDTTPLTNVQDFSFPQSLPQMSKFDTSVKRKTSRTRHRHTYSAGSNSYQRFPPSASSEGTVREEPRATGVNIGHLQNLETLKQAREAAALASSQSSPGYPPVNESELHSITIPASIEDGSIDDDWYFPISDLPPQPSSTSTEFAWLS